MCKRIIRRRDNIRGTERQLERWKREREREREKENLRVSMRE